MSLRCRAGRCGRGGGVQSCPGSHDGAGRCPDWAGRFPIYVDGRGISCIGRRQGAGLAYTGRLTQPAYFRIAREAIPYTWTVGVTAFAHRTAAGRGACRTCAGRSWPAPCHPMRPEHTRFAQGLSHIHARPLCPPSASAAPIRRAVLWRSGFCVDYTSAGQYWQGELCGSRR